MEESPELLEATEGLFTEEDEAQEFEAPELAEDLEEPEQLELPDEAEPSEGQPDEVRKRPSVFISFNSNEQDRGVAYQLYEHLSPLCDVFLFEHSLLPGDEWDEKTGEALERVDFVIALISAPALKEYHYITAELQKAYELYKEHKRPVVIPVYVSYAGSIGIRLSAYISHFQAVFWDDQTAYRNIERIKAAITGGLPPPPEQSEAPGLAGFRVSETRRESVSMTFVTPPEIKDDNELPFDKRLLWIAGDHGVRNYVALALAARTQVECLYDVTKRSWASVNATAVSKSVIVFRDVLPSPHFEESPGEELYALRELAERNRAVIVTSSEEDLECVRQEMRRYEFRDFDYRRVSSNSYDGQKRLLIFEKMLEAAYDAGEVNSRQYGWAGALLREQPAEEQDAKARAGRISRAVERLKGQNRRRFEEIITKWTPFDIERFVTVHLPQVEKLGDLARLMQRNAALEDEVHEWFVSLDEPTRCFLLTMIIFPDLGDEQTWGRYKQVVSELRRLSPGLPLPPLGICRRSAERYVSQGGPSYFLDERVLEAVRQEIAKNYREYFVELKEKLKEWSVPAGRDSKTKQSREARKREIEAGKQERAAIARVVGIVGGEGLEDLRGLLDCWATDWNIHIRELVAIALGQTARSHGGVNHALALLERWCADASSPGNAQWRACAAALALASFPAEAYQDQFILPRVLSCINRLIRQGRRQARFHVAIALKQLARKARTQNLESVMARLAASGYLSIRINVADALNEAFLFDEPGALNLFERWVADPLPARQWVAVCSLITRRDAHARRAVPDGEAKADKYEQLQELLLLDDNAETVVKVFLEAVGHDYHGPAVAETFRELALRATNEAWRRLSAAMTAVPFERLEVKLLPLLRASGLESKVVAVRAEALRGLLETPEHFMQTVSNWMRSALTLKEVFFALALLLRPEPEGDEKQVIATLGECHAQSYQASKELLLALKNVAPSYFQPLSRAVHAEGFRRLLHDQQALIRLLNEELSHTETADDALCALESLAAGRLREELIQVFLFGHKLDPAATWGLFGRLKGSGHRVLEETVYDSTRRLLEGSLSDPAAFASILHEGICSAVQREEVLQLFNYLAAPEPQGHRAEVVHALAEAKGAQVTGVVELLSHPSLLVWGNLSSLQAEVNRVSLLNNIPGFKVIRGLFKKKAPLPVG